MWSVGKHDELSVKWCNSGSKRSSGLIRKVSTLAFHCRSNPRQPHPWLLMLDHILPLDVHGYGWPLIFRVLLNCLISKFLFDSVSEVLFSKQSSYLPVLFCAHLLLDNVNASFIVNIHYYSLLIYLLFKFSHILVQMELSTFLNITLNLWSLSLLLLSDGLIGRKTIPGRILASLIGSFVL